MSFILTQTKASMNTHTHTKCLVEAAAAEHTQRQVQGLSRYQTCRVSICGLSDYF